MEVKGILAEGKQKPFLYSTRMILWCCSLFLFIMIYQMNSSQNAPGQLFANQLSSEQLVKVSANSVNKLQSGHSVGKFPSEVPENKILSEQQEKFNIGRSPLDRRILNTRQTFDAIKKQPASTGTVLPVTTRPSSDDDPPPPKPEPELALVNDAETCSKLFKYDKAEIRRMEELRVTSHYVPPPDSAYVNVSDDCESFRRINGFYSQPLSQEEADFPIAFGIRMHKDVAQFVRLLRTIYMPQNVYCLYVDLKSDNVTHAAIRSISKCLPNTFIASQLREFVYASFSPVEADMVCMKNLLNTNVSWTYFLNVAGQEFPLKTNLELVKMLKYMNGTNDIEGYPLPNVFRHRIDWIHKIVSGNLKRTSRLKRPFTLAKLLLFKGSSYNSFTRKYVEWVLTDSLAQAFINWTRDLDSPDELVWGTLNHLPQAPGGYPVMVTQIAKTHLSREVVWLGGAAYCHGKYIRTVCILSVGDLNWLSNRWEFFANKFDIHYDAVALNCMEARIRNRTLNPNPDKGINWDRINELPHVQFGRNRHKKKKTWANDFMYEY